MAEITFVLFAVFSGLRTVSYVPQIYRVAADNNGATAISYSTWGLWIAANLATALYALVNLKDLYLGFVSVIYATCCIVVVVLTMIKRRRLQQTTGPRVVIAAAGSQDPAAALRYVSLALMLGGACLIGLGILSALLSPHLAMFSW